MSDTTRLRDVHPDMERYLEEDCYCPNEVYDLSGFFFELFPPDTECTLVAQSETHTGVVAQNDGSSPQVILFCHDDGSGRILGATRVDATDNNIGIVRTIIEGGSPDGRKIDEFEPGAMVKSIRKVLSISDAVMVG